MTDDSQLVAQTFHEMRRFCSDIALLLKTGEEVFRRHGWTTAQPDKTSVYSQSYSLDRPRGWLPLRFFRYYSHPEFSSTLAYLAVVINLPVGRENEDGTTYLTAGAFDYGRSQGWGKGPTSKDTKLFQWHLVRKDAAYDGVPTWHKTPFEWSEANQPDKWQQVITGIQSAVTLGLPLHEVTDAGQLESQVIKPLLAEIANRSSVH